MNHPHFYGQPFFSAHWPAPKSVKTLLTTRLGGHSVAPFDTLNLGNHVGDVAQHVARNRAFVQSHIAHPAVYLNQVHKTDVVEAVHFLGQMPDADASWDKSGKVACVVMTADCLPVLLCNQQGTAVAAVHCGWRSLAGGILARTIDAMDENPSDLMAYLGVAISQKAFEVGVDVYQAFIGQYPDAANAFIPALNQGKYQADLYHLARLALHQSGVSAVYGGRLCTASDAEHFFSYRRDAGKCGRMGSFIWLEQQ